MIPKVVFPVGTTGNGTTFPKFSFAKRCKPLFCLLPYGQSANFRTPYGQSVEFCVISFLGIPLGILKSNNVLYILKEKSLL
jgi:hypothetical protein